MALFRIAVESYVLSQEVLEGLKKRSVPMWGGQNCAEHAFKATILVAGNTQRSAHIVGCANRPQIKPGQAFQGIAGSPS